MTSAPTNPQTSTEAHTLNAALGSIHYLRIESELIRRQGAAALRCIAGKAHLREKLLAGLESAWDCSPIVKWLNFPPRKSLYGTNVISYKVHTKSIQIHSKSIVSSTNQGISSGEMSYFKR